MGTRAGASEAATRAAGVPPDGAVAALEIVPERIAEASSVGVFYRQAAKYGDRVLFRHWRDERWQPETWASVRRRALAAAAGLIEAGVQAGDRVVIFGPNSLEWLVADLAIASAGAVSVPIYPSTNATTAQHITANSQAVLALVADDDIGTRLQTNGRLGRIVNFGTEFQAWMRKPSGEHLGQIKSRLEAIRADDLGTIIYTSGTTGEPKGVMLAHRALYATALRTVRELDLSPDDVSLSFLPYAHSFERMSIMAGLICGASGWLSRGRDRLGQDMAEARPTLFPSVPMIYEKMYRLVFEEVGKLPAWKQRLFHWALGVAFQRLDAGRPGPALRLQAGLADRAVLASIRRRLAGPRMRFFASGGAPLGVEIERFFWAVGIPIMQGWGLSETAAAATLNTPEHHRFGTVGRPLEDVQLKIAGDGEVLLQSPGLMQGYFGNEEATRDAFQDGWFMTGDVGEIDADGYLRITDRKKDLIKTAGGKYVAPQALEARLQNERYIERVVVIGDERPYVTALIVPNFEELKRDGMGADSPRADERVRRAIGERVERVNQQFDHFEAIQYFELLDRDLDERNGELTPTLKPKRRVVAENYRDLIEGMYRGKQRGSPAGGGRPQHE